MSYLTVLYACLFYAATAILVGGLAYKIRDYSRTPAPLKIPTTPAPTTTGGVVLRMAREVALFESLFKSNKWIWVFGYMFHAALALVLLRHLRYFTEPVWSWVAWIQPFGTYAGFAMVLLLAIPLRIAFKLEDFITTRHLQNMAKVMLVTGWVVGYGYISEIFMAWYSGSEWELYLMKNRMSGPYAPMFWSLILCNIVIPQALWSKRVRDNTTALFCVAMSVNIGMWLERFVIIVISLHRDYMPSAWGMYVPTRFDWLTYVGTIGLFFTLLFLFIRFLPMISIFEMRTLLPGAHAHPDKEKEHA